MNLLARLRYLLAEGFTVSDTCDIVNAENDCPDIRIVRHIDGTRRLR